MDIIKTNSMLTHDEWVRMGQECLRKEQWGEAINAYQKALILQPDGPAGVALEYIYDVLEYRRDDLLNP